MSSIANHLSSIAEKELFELLIEREVLEKIFITVNEGYFVFNDKIVDHKKSVQSNGAVSVFDEYISSSFSGFEGSYQTKIIFPSAIYANGISVKYRISGWSDISYLAIGHTQDKIFRHSKIPNPSQDEWISFSLGYNDIAFGLRNDWEKPEPSMIGDIRLYVKGRPSTNSTIEIKFACIWNETAIYSKFLPIATDNASKIKKKILFSEVEKYFRRCNPHIKEHVEGFFEDGTFPVSGDTKLNWPLGQSLPEKFDTIGTYRYLWHALQPAISMMIYAKDEDSLSAIFAARDFISSWLENSFFQHDSDTKFAWYDHGAAERLLALLYFYQIGLEYNFDYRFMGRVKLACISHAQLLESEVFYASHQPTRYHNHAWFQDIALIAASVAMDDLPSSSRWLLRAVNRLIDQFNKLIVRDNGYAIFIENSIGYHHGIQRLVDFAGELVKISGLTSSIPSIAKELSTWSDYFRYPDNRAPSQGDTFRKPNAHNNEINRGEPYKNPHALVLSEAGYGVVKGNHKNIPFMMCIFATSLCKTHKHEDNLSFTLFFDGIEWLIDPSMYSHEYSAPIPGYLRSAIAHNNIAIPEVDYSLASGVAKIWGVGNDEGFEILGEHAAYKDVVVKRSLKGKLNKLTLTGYDQIVFPLKKKPKSAYLVFHCGEGVMISQRDEAIYLSHAHSSFQLKILSNLSQPEINRGWGERSQNSSVSGLGFMQVNDTCSVLYELKESVEWSITVDEL